MAKGDERMSDKPTLPKEFKGGIEASRVKIPEGMSPQEITAAIEIIEDWQAQDVPEPLELITSLLHVLRPSSKKL
jgi:hypothetical protein